MSGIVININAGDTFETSSVTASGQLVDIIADAERSMFGIGSDADLIRAIGKYFGKEPNNAYLSGRTPHDDLYNTYKWSEVQRVLEPKNAVILGVTSKPTIVSTKTLKNTDKEKATCTTKITQQVTNTMSSQWSQTSTVSVGQAINYKIKLIGGEVGGTTNIGFSHNWGKNETLTNQTTLASEIGVTVDLKPGESKIVQLTASRGTMHVRITYEAHLTGQTAVRYNPTHKDHHFWGLPIDEILGESNNVEITEDIEVGFYANETAEVKSAT